MSDERRLPRLSGIRLARLVLGFVALAAVAGWAASFVGLHGFALDPMHGYTSVTACSPAPCSSTARPSTDERCCEAGS